MTRDVIVNTTMDFIVGDRRHLELAFKVEEAVPLIRQKAVDIVLKRVQRAVKDELGRDDWHIDVITGTGRRAQAVRVKNKSWQDKLLNSYSGWRGVRLMANNGSGWTYANFSVTPFQELEAAKVRNIFRTHDIGKPETAKDIIHCRLPGYLKDWNGEQFVFTALNEPDDMITELAASLARLAREIDGAINEGEKRPGS